MQIALIELGCARENECRPGVVLVTMNASQADEEEYYESRGCQKESMHVATTLMLWYMSGAESPRELVL